MRLSEARSLGRQTLRSERSHFAPGLHDLHRLLGQGAAELAADGASVTLTDGREMLDFGSYAVTLLGHRPAAVVQAVQRSLDTMTTSTRLLPNPTVAALAAELVRQFGGADKRTRVVVGLTGSDVVEATLKLAMASRGVLRLIAVRHGFHGKTMGALAVTFDEQRRAPFSPLLEHVTFVDPIESAVSDALRADPAAAVIVEPIQGEGGGTVLPPELLRRWCDDAHRHGAYFIADEIQVGLRRCGPMSVSDDVGLAADAILLGKPLGGGVVPLSAAVCSEALFAPLIEDPFFHTSTFGGHPLSAAAGLAALEEIDALGPVVAAIEPVLQCSLQEVAAAQPAVIRSSDAVGLFGVIEATSADAASFLLLEAARAGLLLAPCLTAPSRLRMLPPSTVQPDQLDEAFSMLASASGVAARRLGAGS